MYILENSFWEFIHDRRSKAGNFNPWVPYFFEHYQFRYLIRLRCNHLQLPTPLFLNNLWVSTIILYISKIHGFHGTHGTYTNYAFVLYCWVLSSTRDKFCLFLVKVAAKLCCNFKLFFSYIECDKSLDWTLLNWTWAETNIQLSLLIFHHRVLSEKLTFEVSKIIKTESRIKFFKWTGPCNRCCNPSNLEAWILGWLEEELGSYSVCTPVHSHPCVARQGKMRAV